MLKNTDFKICCLNARSLDRHIDNVQKDVTYLLGDILIFIETRFSPHDPDGMYPLVGYQLFSYD